MHVSVFELGHLGTRTGQTDDRTDEQTYSSVC